MTKLIALLVVLLCAISSAFAADVDVIAAAGQSNIIWPGTGNAALSPLPPNMDMNPAPQFVAAIWLNNQITPMTRDGSAIPAFAQTYVRMTGHNLLIVPTAVGSTAQCDAVVPNQGSWDVNGTLVPAAMSAIDAAIAAVQAGGNTPHFLGVWWAQGEGDAVNLSNGGNGGTYYPNVYKGCLGAMVNRFQTKYPNTMFWIARIGTSNAGDIGPGWAGIRQAQEDMVAYYQDTPPGSTCCNMRIVYRGAACYYQYGPLGSTYPLVGDNNNTVHYSQLGYNLMGHYSAIGVVTNGRLTDRVFIDGSRITFQCN